MGEVKAACFEDGKAIVRTGKNTALKPFALTGFAAKILGVAHLGSILCAVPAYYFDAIGRNQILCRITQLCVVSSSVLAILCQAYRIFTGVAGRTLRMVRAAVVYCWLI